MDDLVSHLDRSLVRLVRRHTRTNKIDEVIRFYLQFDFVINGRCPQRASEFALNHLAIENPIGGRP
jgi:hypothetical protein